MLLSQLVKFAHLGLTLARLSLGSLDVILRIQIIVELEFKVAVVVWVGWIENIAIEGAGCSLHTGSCASESFGSMMEESVVLGTLVKG